MYNMMFNRDDMIHSAVNFQGCGLPIEKEARDCQGSLGRRRRHRRGQELHPMNEHKAKFCWWSIVTDVLHDSLTLCNWVWPMTMSPSKSRDYRGDLDLEAKFYKAVTGEDITTEELYKRRGHHDPCSARTLARHEGTNDFMACMTPSPNGRSPRTPISSPSPLAPIRWKGRLPDRSYHGVQEEFAWDEKTGAPTAECLDNYNLTGT